MKSSQSYPATTSDSSQRARQTLGRKGWPWLFGALILLLGGGGVALFALRRGGPPQQQMMQGQAIPVELEKIQPGTIEDSSQFLGVLDAQQGVVLQPEVDGRITQIFVSSGDEVAAGDPILELSPDRSQAEYSAAEASVSAARAAANTARAQLESAQAEQTRALADLELQQQDFQRAAYLTSEGAQSEQQLDIARRDRDTAQATYNAAERQVAAAQSAVAEAEAALNRTQAQASAAQEDLQDTRIVAPIDGVVGDIPVKLGEFVQVGNPVTTITQNQILELNLSIPVEERERLRTGLEVQIRRPGETTSLTTGQIRFISPQVDATTQSILAKAQFNNARGLLQDDQRIEATVIWRTRPGVLVPVTAVSRLGNQAFVFVAQTPEAGAESSPAGSAGPANGGAANPTGEPPQLIAEQRAVELGDIQGDRYQIINGLEPGETIVVSGILNLTDGVPIQPAGAAPPPGQLPSAP